MMLYYRTDLFKQVGIDGARRPGTSTPRPPARCTPRTTRPSTSAPSPASDPGWFAGLAQQAGAQWWAIDGESWKVGIDDDADQEGRRLLGRPGRGGRRSTTSRCTRRSGTPRSTTARCSAGPRRVWAPGVLEGNAPTRKGKWAMAPLPQWSAGEHATGYWGGSSHRGRRRSPSTSRPRRQFATWLNTDPEALAAARSRRRRSTRPTKTAGQAAARPARRRTSPTSPTSPAGRRRSPSTARGFTFGPNVNVAYSAYKDAFDKAVAEQVRRSPPRSTAMQRRPWPT